MWSTVRSTAARQLRVARAAKINTGISVSSRVARGTASFVIPTSYRLVLSSRSFTDTSAELAAKAAAKPKAAKSTTTGAKKRKPAAKKPAAKKLTTKKAKKPAAKKAAPKRVKKEQDPEVKLRLEVRELKKTALFKEPKGLPEQPWLVYVAKNLKQLPSASDLGPTVKGLAVDYNSLSASEKERLETEASQNRLANEAAYKAWVETHSPIEIDAANRARQRLRKISPAHKRKYDIKDDRLPKRSLTAYTMFTKARWNSGEYAGESFTDTSANIVSQWKSLSAAEKKPYEDSAAADRERYEKDLQSVLNRKIQVRHNKSASP
ncbi:hypothetical protein GE09DRAFT_1192617 [Coniochaeta sp. 2T2.1]|nr:hypothetical protein GE09DRAFT_1192617 [Coniochaeta sp. 2T2.1]